MPRGKDTVTVSVNMPRDLAQRLQAMADYQDNSVSMAAANAIREAVQAWEGDETTRVRVQRLDEANIPDQLAQIRTDIAEIRKCQGLNTAIAFEGLNTLKLIVEISEPDKRWAEGLFVGSK